MIISKSSAEHYIWGDNCDGWYLVRDNDLSSPNIYEVRHYHNHSRQFFFVLLGTATLEVNGVSIELNSQESFEVPPLVQHQMFNRLIRI